MSSHSTKPPTSQSQIGMCSSDHENQVTLLDKMKRSLYNSLCWNVNDSETNLKSRQNHVKSGKIQFSAQFMPCKNDQRKTHGIRQNYEENRERMDSQDKYHNRGQRRDSNYSRRLNRTKNQDKYSNRGQRTYSTYSRRTNQSKNTCREEDGQKIDRKSTRRNLFGRQQATGDEKNLECCSKDPIHAEDTHNNAIMQKQSWVEKEYDPKCKYMSHIRGDLDDKVEDYSKNSIEKFGEGNNYRAASKKMDGNEYNNRKCNIKDKVDKTKLYHEIRKNLYERKNQRYDTSQSSNENLHGKQLKDDCKSYYEKKYPRNPPGYVASRPFISRARSAAARERRSVSDTVCKSCRDCPEDRRKKETPILNSEQHCKQVYVLSAEQCKSFKEKGYIKVNVRVKPNISVSDFNITIKKDKSKRINRQYNSYKHRNQ